MATAQQKFDYYISQVDKEVSRSSFAMRGGPARIASLVALTDRLCRSRSSRSTLCVCGGNASTSLS
jgi:hypothetical protein